MKAIRDIERPDSELLNDLVAEFDKKWATYTKSLSTFLKRVWKPRMRQILDERQTDRTELRRLGVILHEPGEDGSDASESESDEDWSEDDESGEEGDGWCTADEEIGEDEDETDELRLEEHDDGRAEENDDTETSDSLDGSV